MYIELLLKATKCGMNFRNMPELAWELGGPVILTLMGCIGKVMVLYFKKEKVIILNRLSSHLLP